MARIRARDTGPEVALRRGLFASGLRGWRCHRRDLPGVPDLAFFPARVAIFVDGCFWHGHPDFFTLGKSGPYWDAKIIRTQQRDRLADQALRRSGWQVIRLWDFEVEEDFPRCVRLVAQAVAARRSEITAVSSRG